MALEMGPVLPGKRVDPRGGTTKMPPLSFWKEDFFCTEDPGK